MNGTFKNITLTAVFLTISASAFAAPGPDISPDTKDPCVGINALSVSRDRSAARTIADLVNDPDPDIQSCAIRAAGQTKNALAAEALFDTARNYIVSANNKGHYEDNLNARLKALDSIWALGEIGDPKVMTRLLKFFRESDDIVKINMAIGAGKTKSGDASKFLYSLAAKADESNVVRAAAYEMLEENKAEAPAARLSDVNGMEKGDLIYTGGIFGIPQGWIKETPVGHAGIYAGTEVKDGKIVVVIYDCVPDNFKPYGGVRKIFSFYNFTHHTMYAFYGNRVSKTRPTPAQRDLIIKAAEAKVGSHYSDTHFSQKGPVEFDCVGYTEYAYEAAGLNPTPNDQETGWGWPLTPAEQFAATVANTRTADQLILPDNGIIVPPQGIAVPNQGILTQYGSALLHSFGMKAQALPEVNTPVQFEAVN